MADFIIFVVCIALIYTILKICSLLEKRIDKIERVEGTGIVQGWRTDVNFLFMTSSVVALAIRALFALVACFLLIIQ